METATMINEWTAIVVAIVTSLTALVSVGMNVWQKLKRGETEQVATDFAEMFSELATSVEAVDQGLLLADPERKGEAAQTTKRIKLLAKAVSEEAAERAPAMNVQIQDLSEGIVAIATAKPEQLEDPETLANIVKSGTARRVSALREAVKDRR